MASSWRPGPILTPESNLHLFGPWFGVPADPSLLPGTLGVLGLRGLRSQSWLCSRSLFLPLAFSFCRSRSSPSTLWLSSPHTVGFVDFLESCVLERCWGEAEPSEAAKTRRFGADEIATILVFSGFRHDWSWDAEDSSKVSFPLSLCSSHLLYSW